MIVDIVRSFIDLNFHVNDDNIHTTDLMFETLNEPALTSVVTLNYYAICDFTQLEPD